MFRSLLNPTPLVRFLWLVLTWSLISAPQVLSAELELPAPRLVEPSLASPADPVVQGPHYWIVSSRNSAQHPRDWSGCPLEVTLRAPDCHYYRSSLQALTASLIPGAPVCIVVHGSFVSERDNCVQGEEAYVAIRKAAPNCPINVIFYTWPSDGPYVCIAPVDIGIRGYRSDYNGFHVAWLMSQFPEQTPVCLVGHSHGCRCVMATLHLLQGGEIGDFQYTGYRAPCRRIRVVLAAAAFDHHWLNPGERYGLALSRTEGLLNLQNRRDLPLAFYPLSRPFAHRAIARSGLTWRDRSKLGGNSAKVVDYDVSGALGSEHYWPEYYNRPEILRVTVPYLYFLDAAR